MPQSEAFYQLGATFVVLIALLFGIYKLALFAIERIGQIMKEKHRLERELMIKKDTEFLKNIKEITNTVSLGDDSHEKAHKVIGAKVNDGFGMVAEKFKIGHNKLDTIHEDIKVLIKK